MRDILILDDEQAVRQSFADFFEDQMWQPVQASSAEEALDLLEKRGHPKAAIVDIRLPGMDGNEFVREALNRDCTMAFVICTGSPEYEIPDDLKALSCVSNYLFRKPVADFNALETELTTMVNGIEEAGGSD